MTGAPKRGSARNMRRRQKAGKGLWEPEYQRLRENGCVQMKPSLEVCPYLTYAKAYPLTATFRVVYRCPDACWTILLRAQQTTGGDVGREEAGADCWRTGLKTRTKFPSLSLSPALP